MTDNLIKSFKIKGESHGISSNALINVNTSEGAIKDLKVWQGTVEEFQNQSCDLYAWTDDRPQEIKVSSPLTSNINPGGDFATDGNVAIFGKMAQYLIKSDLSIEPITFPVSVRNANLFHDGTQFVAYSYMGNKCCTSADGITWTEHTIVAPSFSTGGGMNSIDSKWIVFGSSALAYSSDEGQTWTEKTFEELDITFANASSFIKADGKLFVIGSGSNTIWSSDGVNWTQADTRFIGSVIKVNGVYYSRSSTTLLTSTDCITWEQTGTLPVAGSLGYSNGLFYCAGSGKVYYSTDLTNWQEYIYSTGSGTYSFNFNIFGYPVLAVTSVYRGVLAFDIVTTCYTISSTPAVGDRILESGIVKDTKITATDSNTITVDGIVRTRASSRDTSKNVSISFKDPSLLCDVADTAIIRDIEVVLKRPLTAVEETSLASTGSLYCLEQPVLTEYNTSTVTKRLYKGVGIWNNSTLPSSGYWHSVAWNTNNSTFVAVTYGSSSNIYAYSTNNGITWTSSTLPISAEWSSVTYGNDKFVAIAYDSNTAVYSVNGINGWSSATLPSSAKWSRVAYGNGKFVVVAYLSNIVAYSTDGITWSTSTLPDTVAWYGVAYGNGMFVAIAAGSGGAAYSTDGITWTASTMPSTDNWYSVTYGNGKFVAVAQDSNTSAYSTDGITWTSSTMPSSASWRSVVYGNGTFVAFASNATSTAYSTNGITWSTSTLPSSANWHDVTYGNGKFVAIAFNSNKTIYTNSITAALYPAQTGYDATATQSLKNINGTIQWVTD